MKASDRRMRAIYQDPGKIARTDIEWSCIRNVGQNGRKGSKTNFEHGDSHRRTFSLLRGHGKFSFLRLRCKVR